MKKTKLNQLLEFPCQFTYKVLGLAHPILIDDVIKIVQNYAPGTYNPEIKLSRKRNYQSVSITINATHIEQIETLYSELGNIDTVRIVL